MYMLQGMKRSRWLAALAVLVALGTVVGTMLLEHRGTVATEAQLRAQLLQGRLHSDSLWKSIGSGGDRLDNGSLVQLLYLERARLGLGSPFRLVELVLKDPLLAPNERRILAFAILDLVSRGEAYVVEPEALRQLVRGEEWTGPVMAHLRLMDSVIKGVGDPRAGELALRLSYRLAVASRTLPSRATEIAAIAAAQLRDGVLARRDALALLAEAARSGSDVFSVLRLWREGRRFLVERPLLLPLPVRLERLAVEALPRIVAALEQLEAQPPVRFPPPSATPAVPVAQALRVAAVAASRRAPPQSPVVVAVAGYSQLLLSGAATQAELSARRRFIEQARNEESLVAEYSLLRALSRRPVPDAALALLTAAVGLRPYAQEPVWLPGIGSFAARDIEARFGVSVSFERGTPNEWRPYLLQALALALADFKRVFPSYDPRGLQVRFGEAPLGERALALHDPERRRIFFPAATGSGVMAHELAHDVDWLAARRQYGSRGYRTDRALRRSDDRLAALVLRMAGAAPLGKSSADSRPTEIFARYTDWFVAAALAREGRLNGYLSAVQDATLIGHGSAASPEGWNEGGALLRALAEMTGLEVGLQSWYRANFGEERRLTAEEVVRNVLAARLTLAELRALPPFAAWPESASVALLRSALPAPAVWGCLAARRGAGNDPALVRAVAQYAAQARARGFLREWRELVRRHGLQPVGALVPRDGPPWKPELGLQQERLLRDAILWKAFHRYPSSELAVRLGSQWQDCRE
jgi:hypothetical protein